MAMPSGALIPVVKSTGVPALPLPFTGTLMIVRLAASIMAGVVIRT